MSKLFVALVLVSIAVAAQGKDKNTVIRTVVCCLLSSPIESKVCSFITFTLKKLLENITN